MFYMKFLEHTALDLSLNWRMNFTALKLTSDLDEPIIQFCFWQFGQSMHTSSLLEVVLLGSDRHHRRNHSLFGGCLISIAPVFTFICTKARGIHSQSRVLPKWTDWYPWRFDWHVTIKCSLNYFDQCIWTKWTISVGELAFNKTTQLHIHVLKCLWAKHTFPTTSDCHQTWPLTSLSKNHYSALYNEFCHFVVVSKCLVKFLLP